MKNLIDPPISLAITGWDLLLDVKRAIREEPKRVNMTFYCNAFGTSDQKPACGAVGCFAGWVATLGRRYLLPSKHLNNRDLIDQFDDVAARRLLGRDLKYRTVIGNPENEFPLDVFNSGEGDACATTKPGTRAHARAVIKRINLFMKVNEVALKARVLERV